MKLTLRQLAYSLGIDVDEEEEAMSYNDMVALLMFREGLSESEAKKSIREDVFRGLLVCTEKGYRVNRKYQVEIEL